MKLVILGDIHGNLTAWKAIAKQINILQVKHAIILGDLIDYGMRPNEVIKELSGANLQILCNLWGNHEKAILDGDLSRFSSQRGQEFSAYTRQILSEESLSYLKAMDIEGKKEVVVNGKRIMCIHGSLEDIFWQGLTPDSATENYQDYDFVLSAHTHCPHMFEKYWIAEGSKFRNKKKTVFINPGSIGQPRNHVPYAQFSVLDTETGEVTFNRVPYDWKEEQKLYPKEIDDFYRQRLELGV